MTYTLAIGDCTYSSWSLRGWLLFDAFGIPVRLSRYRLYSPDMDRMRAEFAPATTLPALRLPEGTVIGETIAIAETLAERQPEAGLWPDDASARAEARYLVAEMHAGFVALRGHCAMNLAKSYEDCAPPPEVLDDLSRLEDRWGAVRAKHGAGGPWLFGRYTAADAFFAPVAARIAGYNLPVGPVSRAYAAAHMADPAFRRWRAMGQAEGFEQDFYRRPYAERPWPGPAPRPATVAEGPSENAACPCSGKPVSHFLRMDRRTWGFCNAFCRDKTLADPEVWPAFMAMAGVNQS